MHLGKLKLHMGHRCGFSLLKHIKLFGILYNLILCLMATREQLRTDKKKSGNQEGEVFQNDPSKETLVA